MSVTPDEVKACCATTYSSEAARWLYGESFHPGGAALTSRLARALDVGQGATVVDIASGPGTSALQLARETGCDVVGVELSAGNVASARAAADSAGLSSRVRFVEGDAEALPLEDASMDGALSECALCTFPDKALAVGEVARVLRPGARLALADMTADTERLPPELTGLLAWVSCIADAQPLDEIAKLLDEGGLRVEAVERHNEALAAMLDRVQSRLKLARLMGAGLLGYSVGQGLELVAAAQDALGRGLLGYGVVVARRP